MSGPSEGSQVNLVKLDSKVVVVRVGHLYDEFNLQSLMLVPLAILDKWRRFDGFKIIDGEFDIGVDDGATVLNVCLVL